MEGVQVLKDPSYVLSADLQLGLVYDSKMEQHFTLESQKHRSIAPGLRMIKFCGPSRSCALTFSIALPPPKYVHMYVHGCVCVCKSIWGSEVSFKCLLSHSTVAQILIALNKKLESDIEANAGRSEKQSSQPLESSCLYQGSA